MIITERRIEANRRNAQLARGPKSATGKSTSSRNAITHGLLSNLRVLPFVETQSDWLAHYLQTTEALQPVGCIEFALAERIALMLWRLNRVARQEREWTAIALEDADSDAVPGSQATGEAGDGDIRESATQNDRLLSLVGRIRDSHEEERLTSAESLDLIKTAIQAVGSELSGAARSALITDCGRLDLDGDRPWTVGRVRSIWTVVAERTARSLNSLITHALEALHAAQSRSEAEALSARRQLDRLRRQRLLPTLEDQNRLLRYESHAERCLFRALHELQRLQAIRGGDCVSVPLAMDVTVNGQGSGCE